MYYRREWGVTTTVNKRGYGCFRRLQRHFGQEFFVSHLGMFAGIIGLTGVLISAILHSTYGGSRFDLLRRDTDPEHAHLNGAGIVFRIGMALTLVPLVPYYFLLSRMIPRRRTKSLVAFGFSLLASIGMIVTISMPAKGDAYVAVCVVCFSVYIATSFLATFTYTSLVDGFVDSIVMPVFFLVPMACSCFVLAVSTAYDAVVFGMVMAVTRSEDDGLASRKWWFLAFEVLYLVSIYAWILSMAFETFAAEKLAWHKKNADILKEVTETII